MPAETTHRPWRDIRLSGFADRATLAQARLWLDALKAAPGHESVAAEDAVGRVLAGEVTAPADLPPVHQAAADGYAIRAAETEGASAYNPLSFALSETADAPRARLVSAGAALPPGFDAILDFGAVSRIGTDRLEVLDPVSPSDGVAARGGMIRAGMVALAAGRRLRPQDIALLGALGIARVAVLQRPLVALAIAGPKAARTDNLGPMLRALIARDGGTSTERSGANLKDRIPDGDANVILVAGRSGAGEDDIAAPVLAEAGGALAVHGIALRPGGSSGLGQLNSMPVILLPGDPPACLAAYDMLASRLIRRIAGLPVELPYRIATLPLSRKIVSAIGFADIVPIAVSGDTAAPVAAAGTGDLPASCRADGFVVVPETLEGHPAGDIVRIHLYDEA